MTPVIASHRAGTGALRCARKMPRARYFPAVMLIYFSVDPAGAAVNFSATPFMQ